MTPAVTPAVTSPETLSRRRLRTVHPGVRRRGKAARRTPPVCLALLAGIAVVGAITLGSGAVSVPLAQVLHALVGDADPANQFVVGTLRLPRLVTALAVGAALAVSGALFQSVSRNPLGSPDIVGFTQGAATGALLVLLVAEGTQAQVALGAVGGGAVTALLVYLLAMREGVRGYRLVLVGIGLAAMLASVNGYLISRAQLNQAQDAAVWLTGSLNGRTWDDARPVLVALVLLVPAAMALARSFRALDLGDDLGVALGVNAGRVRALALLVGVGLAAVATAAAGPIAFVALAAPQIARRLTGAAGMAVVATALTGAALLSASDLAAQHLLDTGALPVGVMTGVVGGGYLIWLLAGQWRGGRG